MKKKVLTSLVLAGVIAATMIPTSVFAASNTTTVGYTSGGNTSEDGKAMVTVPKDVTFAAEFTAVDNFNVIVQVWDEKTQTWIAPIVGTNELSSDIEVSVESGRSFLLGNDTLTGVTGKYKYTVGTNIVFDDTHPGGWDDTQQEPNKDQQGKAGKLTTADPTLEGSVTMTQAPKTGQTQKDVTFTDTLTFSFNGGGFKPSL